VFQLEHSAAYQCIDKHNRYKLFGAFNAIFPVIDAEREWKKSGLTSWQRSYLQAIFESNMYIREYYIFMTRKNWVDPILYNVLHIEKNASSSIAMNRCKSTIKKIIRRHPIYNYTNEENFEIHHSMMDLFSKNIAYWLANVDSNNHNKPNIYTLTFCYIFLTGFSESFIVDSSAEEIYERVLGLLKQSLQKSHRNSLGVLSEMSKLNLPIDRIITTYAVYWDMYINDSPWFPNPPNSSDKMSIEEKKKMPLDHLIVNTIIEVLKMIN
jgi:hypothetical protein